MDGREGGEGRRGRGGERRGGEVTTEGKGGREPSFKLKALGSHVCRLVP